MIADRHAASTGGPVVATTWRAADLILAQHGRATPAGRMPSPPAYSSVKLAARSVAA